MLRVVTFTAFSIIACSAFMSRPAVVFQRGSLGSHLAKRRPVGTGFGLPRRRELFTLNMQENPVTTTETPLSDLDIGTSPTPELAAGGDSEYAAFFNVAKAIVGAGSFALPFVCKSEGVAGGLITIVVAALLSSSTMSSLMESKRAVEAETGRSGLSYVDVARETLGENGARFVFLMTVMASLLVCSSYVAFVGSTLETMAAQDGTIVHDLLPGVSKEQFQIAMLPFLMPISWLRSFGFLKFTSTLGTLSVFAAIGTVMVSGLSSNGLESTAQALSHLPLWPSSVEAYLQSFGSVMFLFAVNFLIFPIERAMQAPSRFDVSMNGAIAVTAAINAAFALLGFAFFGSETKDIVINNLGPGSILTSVKLLLCVDLLLTYPLVMKTSQEIIEKLLFPHHHHQQQHQPQQPAPYPADEQATAAANLDFDGRAKSAQDLEGEGMYSAELHAQWSVSVGESEEEEEAAGSRRHRGGGAAGGVGGGGGEGEVFASVPQVGVRSLLVVLTLLLGQTKGFALITNIAGGLAQGSLAFVIPPALAIKLRGTTMPPAEKTATWVLMAFGAISALLTTYEAIIQ